MANGNFCRVNWDKLSFMRFYELNNLFVLIYYSIILIFISR